MAVMEDFYQNRDLKERALRSLKEGLGRLWKRRTINITEYDPSYKVHYLGNVLTGWAKGEGCVEKPLVTLWKNYQSTTKPNVHMKVTITQSGLKALTKEHGLTEYWSHRITYCASPQSFPKVFCWVYRHEGRRLKQELRCHAVICSKESIARRMVQQLKSRLSQALTEFKRDKLSKQNARLSLANAVYENPSLPRRKILLSTGSQNYRPPLERSKSAPKLMSIEESLEEEDETEIRKISLPERLKRKNDIEQEKDEINQELLSVKDIFKENDIWEKDDLSAQFDINEDKDEVIICDDKNIVELDPRPETPSTAKEQFSRMSWAGEALLARDLEDFRRKLCLEGSDSSKSLKLDNCKILEEFLMDSPTSFFTDFFEEDESTPSLQSLSSGSEGSSCRLPSRPDPEGEDSDESGFVEVCGPSDTQDDKVRDLPHHQLVKSCLLTASKSRCVEV